MKRNDSLSIEHIYAGKVLVLNRETVTLPNGQSAELEIVRHPGASAVVPIKDNGIIILIRQFRHAAGGFIYEIPAGKLHPQEDPQTCAARELEEEVGYRAGRLTLLTKIWTAPGFTDEIIYIYRGSDLQPGRQQLDHDEVVEVVEWPIDKAIAGIHNGTIRDAKTIIGLQLVFLASHSCTIPP